MTHPLATDQVHGDDLELTGPGDPKPRHGVHCERCLDTGAAPMPFSDEATETCDCAAGDRLHERRMAYRGARA